MTLPLFFGLEGAEGKDADIDSWTGESADGWALKVKAFPLEGVSAEVF